MNTPGKSTHRKGGVGGIKELKKKKEREAQRMAAYLNSVSIPYKEFMCPAFCTAGEKQKDQV